MPDYSFQNLVSSAPQQPQQSLWDGLAPGGQPLAPQATPNLLDKAREQYPILKSQDYGYTENFKPNSGFLEHWEPGEAGAAATASTPFDGLRPDALPIDKHGLEIKDPNTRPIDILGDIASHHLVNVDPVVKDAYQKLQDTMTPQQHQMLQSQYEHAQKTMERRDLLMTGRELQECPGSSVVIRSSNGLKNSMIKHIRRDSERILTNS